MTTITGPLADDGQRTVYKQQSTSTFRRVKLIQWKPINGISMTALEQFQLEPTFDETISEIRKQQPNFFTKPSTKCVIYKSMELKSILENDTTYQFWLMQQPTELYFQNVEKQDGNGGCCIIL